MYCTNCGKNNEQGSKFCIHCGLELTGVEKKIESTLPANHVTKSNKNWALIIMGSILGFAFLLIAFAYAYDHLYSLPKYGQDKLKIEAQETQANINAQQQINIIKNNNQVQLQACIASAENKWKNWGQQISTMADDCKSRGGGTCSAVDAYLEAFSKNDVELQQNKSECFKLYPAK